MSNSYCNYGKRCVTQHLERCAETQYVLMYFGCTGSSYQCHSSPQLCKYGEMHTSTRNRLHSPRYWAEECFFCLFCNFGQAVLCNARLTKCSFKEVTVGVVVVTGVLVVIVAEGSYWRIHSGYREEIGDELEAHREVKLVKHWKTEEEKNCDGALEHLRDPAIAMKETLSAFHGLVFTKGEAGWSAMDCHPSGALETCFLFFPLSFFYSTLCIIPFYCQHARPIGGRCGWWGLTRRDSPKAHIVCVTLIFKNSNPRLRPRASFFHLPVTQTSQYAYCTTVQTYHSHALAPVKSRIIFW